MKLVFSYIGISILVLVPRLSMADEVDNNSRSRYSTSESISPSIYHSQQSAAEISQNVSDRAVAPKPNYVRGSVAQPMTVNSHKVDKLGAVVAITKPVVAVTEPVSGVAIEPEKSESLFTVLSNWFSIKPVKPWQKGTLAKKAMKPGGAVPEFDVFSEKVFAYKQGSIGGNGVGGGGCGCN